MKDALGHRINRKRLPLSQNYFMGLVWGLWEMGFDFNDIPKYYPTLRIPFSVDVAKGNDKNVNLLYYVK